MLTGRVFARGRGAQGRHSVRVLMVLRAGLVVSVQGRHLSPRLGRPRDFDVVAAFACWRGSSFYYVWFFWLKQLTR